MPRTGKSSDCYISALRSADGSLVSAKDGLCHFLRSFYLDLFSDSLCISSGRDDLLANVSSVLPSDQSCLCEGLLCQEECYLALKGMACSKAPGCDGLPMEFYLKFWPVLGSDLVSVLNSAFIAGTLSRSQHRGVITLSFKKGDRLDTCNWRPITLLNVFLRFFIFSSPKTKPVSFLRATLCLLFSTSWSLRS